MIINQYYNFYTNEVSRPVADELIARMDALSSLNRNVSQFASSKQFFAVKNSNNAKPELLRKFQEWRDRKVAYGEVRAFRKVSQCCKGQLVKDTEESPFVITVNYDDKNGTVPTSSPDISDFTIADNGLSYRKSYGDIKYSVADGLNKPSFYNGQPQAFLQSIRVSNEGYGGVVQRVTIKMRVFTKEAFEIIDKWYLRPGNEMLVKFGWSVPLTSMETSSEVIHAVIFNFNAVLTDDIGWEVTVHGIAKGNLAVGLALGSSAVETVALNNANNTQQPNIDPNVIPNLTTILKDELNKIRIGFPGITESDVSNIYDANTDLDSDNRPYGIVYESDIFPHGIGRIKFAIETAPQDANIAPAANQAAIQNDPLFEKRQATDAELNTWLEGFRIANPRFVELEAEYGIKSPKAFIEFYKGNFGVIRSGLVGEIVFPRRDKVLLTEEFITGKNPEVTDQQSQTQRTEIFFEEAAGDVIGSYLERQRQPESQNYASLRPPFGPLRRRVLNIMYNDLPDTRSEQQKQLEAAQQEQLVSIQQQIQQQDALQGGVYNDARITDPQSTVRYFICLGDLVYFFNEKIFKQAPELYTAVQLLVENQPTSYDPNLVSAIPTEVILSNARNTQGGMSSYGYYNSVNYGFKYKKLKINNELVDAFGCDGVDFYPSEEFNSKEDMANHREDWGVYLRENGGEKIAAFNIAHIWISVDVINEAYTFVLKDKAIDPQYKTVFDFFEQIFRRIAQASAGSIQLTLMPDNNELYNNNPLQSKILSLENPLINKTQLFRIVDNNFQVPHNLPGAPRSFDFKVNDVNATMLRDVNVALKIPSKLQTVAYTYGRSGMNEDIVDIDDSADGTGGICQKDYDQLVQKRNEILKKLNDIKNEVAFNMSADNIEKLINALSQYIINPVPVGSDSLDTSPNASIHQGWLYSKLYPVELQFKLDGISGFLYGNKVNILNALPSRYSNRVYFTLIKIEHEVQNNDWITTLTAIARLKNSNGLVQFPRVVTTEARPDLCDKVPEIQTPLPPVGGASPLPAPTPQTTQVPESLATPNSIPQVGTVGVNATGLSAFPLPGVPGGGGGFGLPEPDRPVLP
jgi:hypothetical protein